MAGVFVLSLDAEIAWGTYGDRELARRAEVFDCFPGLFRQLLKLLEHYRVPATWAFVGHLLVPPEDTPECRRPHYSFSSIPDRQRAPRRDRPHWFYAPELIAWVRESTLPHELATHTFTHLLADDPAVDEAMWREDLSRCVALSKKHQIELSSLVFPQNRIRFLATLPDYGIVCYRGLERSWFRALPEPLRRLGQILHRVLGLTPPTYPLDSSLIDGPIVNLPASQLLLHYQGARACIPTRSRVAQARRGLRRAAERGELFHLWFHPFNLASSPRMWQALEQILQELDEWRERGGLVVSTMGNLAAQLMARQGRAPEPARRGPFRRRR